MARTFKKTDLAIDNSEVRDIVKELKQYGKKDVLKTLAKFHREIAKEQLADIRPLAKKQRAPKARASAMGFTASGTRTEAKINIKNSFPKKPSALSLEFGRRYIYVPTKNGKTRAVQGSAVGKLRYSRPGADFRYKKWIGNRFDSGDSTFSQLGKKGYVVGKTLDKNQNEIAATYNDRMYDALIKAIK